jgi:hypothetical protein
MGWRALGEAIISMEFGPGMMIDKIAGCERMRVSRCPVSAALARLVWCRPSISEEVPKRLEGNLQAQRKVLPNVQPSQFRALERARFLVLRSEFMVRKTVEEYSREVPARNSCDGERGTGGAAMSRCSGDEIASLFQPAAGPFDE